MGYESMDESLPLTTFAAFQHTADTIAGQVYAALGEYRLTVSQFAVLEALYRFGPLCQKELAVKILKTSGNLTMVTDNLEKRALVVRRRRESDRRYLEIALSTTGKTLIGTIIPAHAARVRAVMALLSPTEQEQLAALCGKFKQIPVPSHEEAKRPPFYAVTRPIKIYDD